MTNLCYNWQEIVTNLCLTGDCDQLVLIGDCDQLVLTGDGLVALNVAVG